jgi:Fe-S oxidoreductase
MNFAPTLAGPGTLAPIEQIVLLALFVLSLAVFARQAWRMGATILAARPDAGYTLAPVAPRLRRLLLEVLAQSKIIRQRPLVGLAHAFVFWAFCAFAVVTLNHLALAFNVGFLNPQGVGAVLFNLAAFFAVACFIAIAGLAVRRFALRPRWLGAKLSYGSALVALLIAALMATYLAAFCVPDASPAAHRLWWLHTLVLLAFLPLIPRTKHLHLLLAPLAVFFARPGFAQIPPLVGEEDFGLVAGKDLTRIAALEAYSCVECGRCMEHCPAAATGKELNPKELVLGLRDYLHHFGPHSEELLAGRVHPLNALFECTTCGACQFQCPVGVEHLPLIVGMRRGVVNTGEWQHQQGARLFLNLERTGNPLGRPHAERERFIKRAGLPIFDGSQQLCLWLGCMGSYDPRGHQIVTALAAVLRAAGVSFGVLRREQCTGDAARRLGNDLLFQQLTEANLEMLRQAGVARMVSICPHCVQTIAEDWKEFGVPPAIEHHSELLTRLASSTKEPKAEEKIVYHDACYLARYRGVVEEPRKVVAAAGQLVEPERTRERGFCCGAGGGLFFLGEEQGERIGHNRARELAATGAATVAAACPFCSNMLGDALQTMGAAAPQLVDIAELAARRFAPHRGAAKG